MSNVGLIERRTQNRVVALLCDTLGYTYLGNSEERENKRTGRNDRPSRAREHADLRA